MRQINTINTTINNFNTFQLKLPLNLDTLIEQDDSVVSFLQVFSHIDLNKHFAKELSCCKKGRKGYSFVNLLKVVLFSFMEEGYASTRDIEKKCKYDLRYRWLLDNKKAPTHMTICNFINQKLEDRIEDILKDISLAIIKLDDVDLNHVYIDGSKFEANANKYTWVWKKASIKNRTKLYSKISKLFEEINETILFSFGLKFAIKPEYSIDEMDNIVKKYSEFFNIDKTTFVYGKGKVKTVHQRNYELLKQYTDKLKQYARYIDVCGEHRNSFSKTDKDATFLRVKKDYMRNDQLLPAYNMSLAICDEYILSGTVSQFASDSDCFVPLVNKFISTYNHIPQYVVGDAGYGSYNNLLFCHKNNIEKYIKFPMYEKTVKDKKYSEDIFKVKNFRRDHKGFLVCPNNKKFYFHKTLPLKGNNFGRTVELYKCSSCKGCKLKNKCHSGQGDRIVRLNEELSSFHDEVLNNLQSIHGALLLQNRSIQAEGAFGNVKWNRRYKRVFRRGINSVNLEFQLLICGYNLYKFHNKKFRPPD
ncbi:MAG: transposase [Christensenellales bacterium]